MIELNKVRSIIFVDHVIQTPYCPNIQKFRAHLLESDQLLDVIAYLLCYCLENKDKQREFVPCLQPDNSPYMQPEHHGLCRALSYILQSLSAEKSFGQQMQSAMPLRIPIPPKWAAAGTAADFFVSVGS
jgi:hypothetical protein